MKAKSEKVVTFFTSGETQSALRSLYLQALLDQHTLSIFTVVVDYGEPRILNCLSLLRMNQPLSALTQAALVIVIEAHREVFEEIVAEQMLELFQVQRRDELAGIVGISGAKRIAAFP